MRKFYITLFIIVGILCLTVLTYAAIPRVINYQGKLTDKDDNSLTGNFLITFRFYDVEKEVLSGSRIRCRFRFKNIDQIEGQ